MDSPLNSRYRVGAIGLIFIINALVACDADGPQDVIQLVEACAEAREVIGSPASILYSKNIGNAGEWSPPGPGFTHKTAIKGPKGIGTVYHSKTKASFTFYTGEHIVNRLPDGTVSSSSAEVRVIDLISCRTTHGGDPGSTPH